MRYLRLLVADEFDMLGPGLFIRNQVIALRVKVVQRIWIDRW